MKKLFFLFSITFLFSCNEKKELVRSKFSGNIFGTYYNVQLFDTDEVFYQKDFDSIFKILNNSMSTYQSSSLISKINNGDNSVIVDNHFRNVFKVSKSIYKETNGVFDPTIGGIVNAWDFGPKKEIIKIDSILIDSLMRFVGFDKVKLTDKNYVHKKQSQTFLDFNAIAKGYALDVLALFLDTKNHDNYLIDIGGEVLAKGTKPNNKIWKIGIDKPNFEGYQETQRVLSLLNKAMATSGVYRKFKTDSLGRKYAHIINSKTGYPSKTNILSVSVIAESCMVADAYATAFQVIGVEGTEKILEKHKELKVYFIYEVDGKVKTLALNGFPE